MSDSVYEGFFEDTFTVSSKRPNIADQEFLGYGYSIPDFYWRAEELLPDHYLVSRFGLREFRKKERAITWPEVDMHLNLDREILPVGWRVAVHLLQNQDLIPLEWLEYLSGNKEGEITLILFPYAACYWRARTGSITVSCPAFFHDRESGRIEFQGMERHTAVSGCKIAVYYQ